MGVELVSVLDVGVDSELEVGVDSELDVGVDSTLDVILLVAEAELASPVGVTVPVISMVSDKVAVPALLLSAVRGTMRTACAVSFDEKAVGAEKALVFR